MDKQNNILTNIMETINSFFLSWFCLGFLGLMILPFRSDWVAVQIDLKRLFFSSFTHFVISSIIAYLFMPLILIDSLINIFRNV
jgi:hypothetical protein